MIYFDHAATSFPKPPAVAAAVTEAIGSFGNPSRSAHAYALAAGRCAEYARLEIGELFHCPRPERIAFTKNVTEALNIAIQSVDGHIVTTAAEHNSVLRPAHSRPHTIVPVDAAGYYTLADIAGAVRPDTGAIVVGHASNLTGNIAPVREIGAFCREKGLIFILDTAQTAGLAPIDMDDIGVDALCFTGHKALYGLQGTGGICLSERFTPRPLLTGGSGSRSFELTQPAELPDLLEAGTLNGHGIAGLLAGVRYVRANGPAQLLAQANRLAARFYRAAKALGGAVFYGDYTAYDAYDDYDAAAQRMPIVALNLGRLPSGDVAGSLSEKYGIAVRAGAHCAPLLHRRFGTLTQGAARFSFSHMNTEAEVDAALAALAAIKANPAL